MLEVVVDDIIGRDFWRVNFPGQIKVPWKDFIKRFYQAMGRALPQYDEHELPIKPSGSQLAAANVKQKREFAIRNVENFRNMVTMFDKFYNEEDVFLLSLKLLFVFGKDDLVALDHFGAVLGWLGPMDPNLLKKFAHMIQTDWFHGFMSKTESEDRLRHENPGVYLVRFSNNNPNHFVISKVNHDKTMKHMLVKHDPGKGFAFANSTYATFDELLTSCAKKFHLQTPCTNSIFKTMVTAESAYSLV